MEVKLLQPEKQYRLNEVTDEGMVIVVKSQQLMKQNSPKDVTEEGISMEVKLLQ